MNPPPPFDERGNRARVQRLRASGVTVWSPERVFVGEEVRLERIEPGAVLMNAVLRGESTCVGRESQIGGQGSATITDCHIGRDVEIGAGSYAGCVLLDRVRTRGFAEVRSGTVLEEEAELAHTVGLKNSFLGAGVVAGSCVNFCDVYVTGGTSRADHSEIGSGTVHFNFSPKRDKFASLFGNSTGLLMHSAPVFVGGNSGLVAPLCVPFGAVIPAGTTLRAWPPDAPAQHSAGARQAQKALGAVRFLAALQATLAWYAQVRLQTGDEFERGLYRAAGRQIEAHLAWRRQELARFLQRVAPPAKDSASAAFYEAVRDVAGAELRPVAPPKRFLAAYIWLRHSSSHIEALAAMPADAIAEADAWLAGLEQQYIAPAEQAATLLGPEGQR